MATASDGQIAYLEGQTLTLSIKTGFLIGSVAAIDSQFSYMSGNIFSKLALPVMLAGESSALASKFAFLQGLERSSILAYMEGTTVANKFIWLKSSDLSMQFKFRVIEQGYTDGELQKMETRARTIGGGIDHSVGAVYQSWKMVVRVRHTESEANYGTLADLEAFYRLNNPGGTPTNQITLTDHHGIDFQVHMMGDFAKQFMGSAIEGEEAWSLVGVMLENIENE